ncbi:MAG: hypothetical protein WD750_07390 [Gammaproteobacteria bacterium]
MTLVLLDTNAYLRLARRIKPLLGVKFGQKEYSLTILKDVEKEIHRSPRLQYYFPWFDHDALAKERLAGRVRLSKDEKLRIEAAQSVLRAHVLENVEAYISRGHTPPSTTDCFCLAFGMVRPAIVTTDDLGMHQLAGEFELSVWHGHELLRKMRSAKLINNEQIQEIYTALENNNDLPESWKRVKHTVFKKIFGPGISGVPDSSR